MSAKPGRNDPCHCGSGKKYKRCCLHADAVADSARLAAEREALDDEDDIDDDWLDEEDVFEDDWYLAEPFAREDVLLVSYTRGFAEDSDQFNSGEGFQVTEWIAPEIPREILDVLESEAAWKIDGVWGDPDVARPIQLDLIAIETMHGSVVIEARNRGVISVLEDDEELASLTRVCEALRRAAESGTGRSWISEAYGDDDSFEDGEHYDPETGPDPREWLALSETERIERIRSWHEKHRVRLPAPELHAALQTAVESQIALEIPQVLAALQRLRRSGLTRHDAIHAIASVLTEVMHTAFGPDAPDSLMPTYGERLDRLTAEEWLRLRD